MDKKTYILFPVHFEEIEDSTSDRLNVWVVATHADILINNRVYPRAMLEKSVKTWLRPYRKPVLVNHNRNSDPIGRVVHAEFIGEEVWNSRIVELTGRHVPLVEGSSGAIVLKLEITDAEAIEKIKDGRYHTVSIGGIVEHAYCSVCGADWIEDEPCEHIPGKSYDGKPMYFVTEGLKYTEVSFVSVPADEYAYVIKVGDASAVTVVTDAHNERIFIANHNAKKEVLNMPDKDQEIQVPGLDELQKAVDALNEKITKIEEMVQQVTGIANTVLEKVEAMVVDKAEVTVETEEVAVKAEDQAVEAETVESAEQKPDAAAVISDVLAAFVEKIEKLTDTLQNLVTSESEQENIGNSAEEAKDAAETEPEETDVAENVEDEKPKVKPVENPAAVPEEANQVVDVFDYVRKFLHE